MRRLAERPLLTTRYDRAGDFRPEPGSAFVFRRSIEDRSFHVDAWGTLPGVSLIEITDEQTHSFTVGENVTRLRSSTGLEEFWRHTGAQTAYIDITGLRHHVWAALVKSACAVGIRLLVVYVEPIKYRPSLTPTVDVILLNPPFSCRGGTLHHVEAFDERVRASTALAFVLLSLERLSVNGEAAIVVPDGVLNREKDEAARRVLEDRFVVRTVRQLRRREFVGCVATARVIHVRRRKSRRNSAKQNSNQTNGSAELLMVRGTIQMHRVSALRDRNGSPLVHSTNLREGMVAVNGVRVKANTERRLCSPSVVVPRVGIPQRTKICVYEDDADLVMSDCVISTECSTPDIARMVQRTILDHWDEFSEMYSGTCARYLTLRSYQGFLRRRGFSVECRASR